MRKSKETVTAWVCVNPNKDYARVAPFIVSKSVFVAFSETYLNMRDKLFTLRVRWSEDVIRDLTKRFPLAKKARNKEKKR